MILVLTILTDIGVLEANTMAFPLASYKTWQTIDAFCGPISFVIRLGRKVPNLSLIPSRRNSEKLTLKVMVDIL